jgi:hypothetical protein
MFPPSTDLWDSTRRLRGGSDHASTAFSRASGRSERGHRVDVSPGGGFDHADGIGRGPKPSIQYLTCDRRFIDGRPCFDPTGTTVLFMRTPIDDQNQTWLYTIPATSARHNPHHCQAPDPFFVDRNLRATRPDWSWSRTSFEIAFAGNSNLHLLNTKTRKSLFVDCQPSGSIVLKTLSYPSWTADGSAIVLTNYSEQALEHQQLLRVPVPPDPSVGFSPVCTAVTDPSQVWPGMCSVSPSNPNLVAFAGQTPNLAKVYDQNWNQIWVQNGASAPLEVDGIQGRAPWWSPSGTAIAFETILTPDDLYNPFLRIWVLPLTVDRGHRTDDHAPRSFRTARQVVAGRHPDRLRVRHSRWQAHPARRRAAARHRHRRSAIEHLKKFSKSGAAP